MPSPRLIILSLIYKWITGQWSYDLKKGEAVHIRIAIGQVTHETNTFSNVPATEALFRLYQWAHGDDIIVSHLGVRSYVGGMIDKGYELGVELVPTFAANCCPSGLITRETYEMLEQELTAAIKAAGPLDAVCLSLHGAGVAEGAEDLEGSLLKAVRQVVGYDIPVIASLDLHGNITETMVNEATALLGVNFYPHTDCFERGQEAMELTVKTLRGEIQPVMALTRLPMLIFPSTTYQSPAKDINEICWTWEKNDGVLDCTFFHGFAKADTAATSASIITITNDDRALAKDIGEQVASIVWERREQFVHRHLTPQEGLERALALLDGPVVINETSDNPGGGAPGDGTYLLSAMLEKNAPRTCFGFLYDPSVAEVAHQEGAGALISVELGGKTDSRHGSPIPVTAYVKTLSDGKFIQSSPMGQGARVNLGKSARLQVGNVDVIVTSVKAQTLDEQMFLLHGIDVRACKVVGLKSSQHFRAGFQPIATEIITVDSPGISTSNAAFYEYSYVQRPIFPLDD